LNKGWAKGDQSIKMKPAESVVYIKGRGLKGSSLTIVPML
jgi:hypothetical protein